MSDAHPDVLVSRDLPDSNDDAKVRQLHKSDRTDQTCKPSWMGTALMHPACAVYLNASL
jgi:hypothetical protein